MSDAPERPKYPWQERFDRGPYVFAYGVKREAQWAAHSERDRLRQKHAQAALANLDELEGWLTSEEGIGFRAYLERMAGPVDVALRGVPLSGERSDD